jgi:hypothetical protein
LPILNSIASLSCLIFSVEASKVEAEAEKTEEEE